jgi:hypothetical protein
MTSAASGAAPLLTRSRQLRSWSSSGWVSSIWIIDGTRALVLIRWVSTSDTQDAGSNHRIR